MDTNVRCLLQRIQNQLGSVLRDSGHDPALSVPAGDGAQKSRSSDQFKPDESGISSEEGCLPGPAFSQLANIATLVQELEMTLETGGMHTRASRGNKGEESCEDRKGVSSISTPDPQAVFPCLVVLGPPGTQPQRGKTLARYDQNPSVVYSRSSSHLLACGGVPNTALVVLKDSQVPRSAEVTVVLPKEGTRDLRWTRAGTRAMVSSHQPAVSYLEESETSSSEFSSSDSGMENSAYNPDLERMKRVRRKQLLQDARGSRGLKSTKRVGINTLISSAEEEREAESGEEEENANSAWDGSVQMECEVGGEDVETQAPIFSFPSPGSASGDTAPSTVTISPGRSTNLTLSSPPGIYTVYEDLNLPQPNQQHLLGPAKWKRKFHGAVLSGTGSSAQQNFSVRPCAVSITSLPRHIVDHFSKKSTATGMAEDESTTHFRRNSTCSESSTSTSTSSDSHSMLLQTSHVISTGQSHKDSSPVPDASVKLTPRRQRVPVARRSLPFSHPPAPKSPHTMTALSKKNEQTVAEGVRVVPVDWSPDDDFQVNPRPSFILSPVVEPSRSASVKTDKSSTEVSSSRRSPVISMPTFSGAVSSSLLEIGDMSVKREGGGSTGMPKLSSGKNSPAKTASSITEDATDSDNDVKLPVVISCAGCGNPIRWRSQHIHKHQKLDVLICQDCCLLYHTGSFEVIEGSEIYCTLCGDGGNLVCCDNSSCTSSFCQSCIQRTAGENYLAQLIDNDTVWECFCCNKTPLGKFHELCNGICEYYKNRRQRRKKMAHRLGKPPLSSDTESDSFLRSLLHSGRPGTSTETGSGEGESHFAAVDMTNRAAEGCEQKGGEGVSGDEGGGRGGGEGEGGRPTGKERRGGKEESSDGGNTGGKEGGEGGKEGGEGGPKRSGNGRRDRKKSNKKERGVDLSESDSEMDSSDEEDSPQVDTDDISISDASLFDGNISLKKKKSEEMPPNEMEVAQGDNSGELSNLNEESENKSLLLPPTEKLEQPKKKTPKSLAGPSARRVVLNSDSDSDFESLPQKVTPRKHSLSSSSSSSSANSSREEKTVAKTKKIRLHNILSSGSDNEQESPLKMKMQAVPDFGGDRNDDGDPPSPGDLPGLQDRPIVYASPRQVSLSSDSDEVSVLERKQAKKGSHLLGSDDDGEHEAAVKKEKLKKEDIKKRSRKREEISSGDDFEGGEGWMRGVQLKRRRVVRALLSDSDSDAPSSKKSGQEIDSADSGEEAEEEEEEGEEKSTPGRKRKKIRKLLTDAKLQDSTKEAQRLEKERIERLKKRQASLTEKEDELILEDDPVTKKPLVKVRQSLVKSIKPHQWEGIRFLYDVCVEKLQMFKEGRAQSGAILAHCMGLGKSLQVIAFIDALLMREDSGVARVLILSPVNTIYNWRNEYDMWIPNYECDYKVYLLVDTATEARCKKLERWFSSGGVLFAGYELFRNLVMGKRLRKKKKESFEKYLLDPGPDIIVCDEGHVMRNSSSKLSIVLQKVRTLTRIVLTGTPLQNNLIEYHTMVSFVKPNLLGTVKEFKNRFSNPITNGQCRDSTPYDVRFMKNRAHVLHELLSGTVQRRDYRVLARFLPPKQEFVLFIRLSPVQEKLYCRYLEKSPGQHTASDLFSTFSNLQKVWNHPWVLKLDEDRRFEREERRRLDEESDGGSLNGFIVSGSEEEEEEEEEGRRGGRGKKKQKLKKPQLTDPGSRPSSSTGPLRPLTPSLSRSSESSDRVPSNQPTSTTTMLVSSDDDDTEFPVFNIKADPDADLVPPTARITRSNKHASSKSPLPEDLAPGGKPGKNSRPSSPQEWYDDILTADCEKSAGVSGKLIFLLDLLQEAGKLKEKVLVFTQSILTLDLIEEVLSRPENGEWTPGLDYYRLDGSTRSEMRTHQMSDFNEVDNEQLRLYLISTRAGSLGVNLVAANRVVIFDACWNPSHDLQAVFRSYRFGQTKPIFVYRLLAKGTMEEKIYDRQVTKESLARRVVDEKQIGRHYNASDLAELFTYSPAPPPPPPTEDKSTYKRPKDDMVLLSILEHMQPEWVINYHEHDSLLEHVFSEELSEEDRKAAWEDYQAQMTSYNYRSLQSKLDEGDAVAQLSSNSALSGVKLEPGRENVLLKSAAELLTLLTNTNRSVKNLIRLLHDNATFESELNMYQCRGVAPPPNLTARVVESGKQITAHYAQVGEGVNRVNSTLQKCHSGEIQLDSGVNQLANQMRSELIRNLDQLRSGSNQPVATMSTVGGVSQSSRVTQQQIAQHLQQQRALLMQQQQRQAGQY